MMLFWGSIRFASYYTPRWWFLKISAGFPFAPGLPEAREPGSADPYRPEFYESSQQLSLAVHAAPFRGEYEDYDKRKSFKDDGYDTRSALMSNCMT